MTSSSSFHELASGNDWFGISNPNALRLSYLRIVKPQN